MKTIKIDITDGVDIGTYPDTISKLRMGELVYIDMDGSIALCRVSKATTGCTGCYVFEHMQEDNRRAFCPVYTDGRLACCGKSHGLIVFSSVSTILEGL